MIRIRRRVVSRFERYQPRRLRLVWTIGLLIGLVGGSQASSQTASEHYERGLVAYNDGEIRTAYIHLMNALEEDPTLLSALLLLGRTHLAMGNGSEAREQLAAADRLGADPSLTQVPLAQAYLMQGQAKRVISDLFPLGADAKNDAEVLVLRGQAHLELGDLYDAERSFDQAWRLDPESVPALLGRVRARLARGALDGAVAEVRRALELDPRNAQALYLAAGIRLRLGQPEQALADFEQAVASEPAHLPAQIGRIGVLVDLGRLDEAAAAGAVVRENHPQDPRVLYLAAVIANRRGDVETAAGYLREAESLLSQLPGELIENHSPTLLLTGIVAFSLKKWELAGDYLNLFRKRHPDDVGTRKLLARILLERDRIDGAIALLEPALQLTPYDSGLLSLLADAYMLDGWRVKASALIDRAVAADQKNPELAIQQAVTAFALGRPGQAASRLDEIFTARPDLDVAAAPLVVMLMQEQRSREAAELADDLVDRHPRDLTYLNLRGAVHFASGNRERARDSFRAALEIDPAFVPARLNLAKLELREGKPQEAKARLESLLADEPNHAGAMLELARTLAALGVSSEALRWAENAVRFDPDSAPASVYLSDLLLEMGESDRAAEIAELMEFRVRDDAEALAAVARAYMASDLYSKARAVLQRASGLAGYDAFMLLGLAGLQQQGGDPDGALWSLRKATEGDPDFVPARIRLGESLNDLDMPEKARDVAGALQRDFPGQPYGFHLEGVIHQRRNEHAAAMTSYSAALKRRPDSPILAVRVYETKRIVQGDEQAMAFLSGWVATNPSHAIGRQALAEGYFRAGDLDRARSLYEEVLTEVPDSPLLLNNLALIYLHKEDSRALEYAQKAYQAIPASPQIADTLGWVLVRIGHPGEGLRYLRDAQSRAADDPGIGYHIATALADLGRRQEAMAELSRVLQPRAEFDEREEAEAMMERLRSSAGDRARGQAR